MCLVDRVQMSCRGHDSGPRPIGAFGCTKHVILPEAQPGQARDTNLSIAGDHPQSEKSKAVETSGARGAPDDTCVVILGDP